MVATAGACTGAIVWLCVVVVCMWVAVCGRGAEVGGCVAVV